MADFWKALYYVLDHEGGFSNHVADKGGRTNYGITQATLNRYIKSHPGTRVPDKVELLSVKDAEEIYRAEYWKFDKICSQRVATKVFDMAVNMGVGTATRLLQKAVNASPDGILGPKTLDAVNTMEPEAVLLNLVNLSLAHYRGIIERDESQNVFRKGWERRAKTLPPE